MLFLLKLTDNQRKSGNFLKSNGKPGKSREISLSLKKALKLEKAKKLL